LENTPSNNTGIRVIPPVIFFIALAVAFVLNWIWPVLLLNDGVRYSVGPVLIIASFAVMPPVLRAFRQADTTFDVRRIPSALITEGMYRYSRNPTYISMITVCIGIAVVSGNVWVLLTTAITALYLNVNIVPIEEKYLEAQFGEEYRQYKIRVRRWL